MLNCCDMKIQIWVNIGYLFRGTQRECSSKPLIKQQSLHMSSYGMKCLHMTAFVKLDSFVKLTGYSYFFKFLVANRSVHGLKVVSKF